MPHQSQVICLRIDTLNKMTKNCIFFRKNLFYAGFVCIILKSLILQSTGKLACANYPISKVSKKASPVRLAPTITMLLFTFTLGRLVIDRSIIHRANGDTLENQLFVFCCICNIEKCPLIYCFKLPRDHDIFKISKKNCKIFLETNKIFRHRQNCTTLQYNCTDVAEAQTIIVAHAHTHANARKYARTYTYARTLSHLSYFIIFFTNLCIKKQ